MRIPTEEQKRFTQEKNDQYSQVFDFLKNEPDLYTKRDLKKRYI